MQLHQHTQEFDNVNTKLVAVSFTGGYWARAWQQETQLPIPLVIDEERTLYQAFGLQQSFWGAFGLRSTWYYLKNLKFPRIWGNPLQLGGDFIIDAAGVLRWRYRSTDNTDRPSVETLLQALERIEQPEPTR